MHISELAIHPLKSARRRATVTICVPLAVKASRIDSLEGNFPVPRNRREWKERPAMVRIDMKKISDFRIQVRCEPRFKRRVIRHIILPTAEAKRLTGRDILRKIVNVKGGRRIKIMGGDGVVVNFRVRFDRACLKRENTGVKK